MFKRIKFFFLYLKYFITAKKIWQWPRQTDVLIYDAMGQTLLLEYLQPWNPEVFHVRSEFINIPVLLFSLFSSGKKSDAYTDCFIKRVNPKLVVTYIDNNPNFYTISQRHLSVKTMFIQNGTRSYYGDIFQSLAKLSIKDCSAMTVDYMLTHGSNIGDEFSRYIKGKVIPIGSLKNNISQISKPILNDVVSFVSQWIESGFVLNDEFYSHSTFFKRVDKPIVEFLIKYVAKNNKQLMIIPRTRKGDVNRKMEEAYFKELIGSDAVFLEPVGAFGSYKAIDISVITVGVDSTLINEAIARGSKAAIFSTRSIALGLGSFTYGWPGKSLDNGPFWTNHSDPENFERIMDQLLESNEELWHDELKEYSFDKLMAYDPGNGILKSILTKELGSLPSAKQ